MAGPRKMPSMVTEMPGQTAEAWAGLTAFERPFLTLWAANDPGNLGRCATQQRLIDSIPGAAGQPHDRLPEASHFLQDDQGAAIAARLATFFQSEGAAPFGANDRYCEILLGTLVGDVYEFDVWGTQGLNDCPADAWEALDPEMIAAQHGVDEVVMNGPRYWLPNVTGSLESVEIETFGALTMVKIATFDVEAAAATGDATPYTEEVIERTTTFTYPFGTEIYELSAPDGSVYVMQSMSQIIDPTQTLDDLPNLGDVLALPAGWTFNARTLPALLTLVAEGQATVLQDELDNTYQKVDDDVAP